MQIQTDHKLSATAQFCSVWNLLMGRSDRAYKNKISGLCPTELSRADARLKGNVFVGKISFLGNTLDSQKKAVLISQNPS